MVRPNTDQANPIPALAGMARRSLNENSVKLLNQGHLRKSEVVALEALSDTGLALATDQLLKMIGRTNWPNVHQVRMAQVKALVGRGKSTACTNVLQEQR